MAISPNENKLYSNRTIKSYLSLSLVPHSSSISIKSEVTHFGKIVNARLVVGTLYRRVKSSTFHTPLPYRQLYTCELFAPITKNCVGDITAICNLVLGTLSACVKLYTAQPEGVGSIKQQQSKIKENKKENMLIHHFSGRKHKIELITYDCNRMPSHCRQDPR